MQICAGIMWFGMSEMREVGCREALTGRLGGRCAGFCFLAGGVEATLRGD